MNRELFDLTNPQKSIWMTEQFYSGTNINNIVGYLKIEKTANIKALEQALNYFVARNDSFRTKLYEEDSVPKQYFDNYIYENVEVLDLKDDNQLKEFENHFPKQCIKLFNNLLFIAKILRFPNGDAILVLSVHHLISDAWTMSLCLEEIHEHYIRIINNEKIDLSPSPSYIDFIETQNNYMNSTKLEDDKLFWEKQFSDLPTSISFKNSTNVSINSARKVFVFDKNIIDDIHSFCKVNKISDYVFLLSIFSIYFKNIFNTNNFIIGNPVLNRSNFKEKRMTGMFISIMPFIVSCNDTDTFIELCHKLASNQKQMYRHIKYPYHEILNYIRTNHEVTENLYDIVFSYQNAPIASYAKWLHTGSQAESLQIHIKNLDSENNTMAIHYDYLTDLFSENDIISMHERIVHIINQVIKDPIKTVSNIDIISDAEKNLILMDFNNTFQPYNNSSTIVKEFEQIVDKFPNNIAVIDKNISLTYKELNNRANIVAKEILNSNICGDIVAFSLKRSFAIIVTILGILKSGHVYMPIDPDYPSDRINYMLKNSNCDLLITSNDLNICHNKYIKFENLNFSNFEKNPNILICSEKPCYIMYTSGSTGVPKAVTIKHSNVLNFVRSMQSKLDYTMSSTNTVLSVTTVCFDIFVFEVYPTLLSGLTLVIADELESKSPKLLSELIKKHKISKILTTPSRIELLFTNVDYLASLSCIKEFILGGEPFPKKLLTKLQKNTKAKIYNMYGPTETTVYSTFKELTDTNIITIGKPIANTQVYVLNEYNKLQPLNQIGEICISGSGVGLGYYHNLEKTNSVFVNNPYGSGLMYKTGDLGYWQENGELICLGRKDYQVKIRGYRIELDDISNNILTFPNIEKCVVVDKTDSNDKKFLCAYFTACQKIDVGELKRYLINLLPNYMIPKYYMQLDKLPLTANHKIDRIALPELLISETSDSEYVEPNTKIQKILCNTFENSLNIKNIGITNDIFDYNIDSLDIIKIQTKLLDYNLKLNTQDFYKYRTIKELANLLDHIQTNKTNIVNTDYLANINNCFNKHSTLMPISKHQYNNILLIGSTGYLGIHLLEELLRSTNATITCMIRSKNEENPTLRLVNLFDSYFNKALDVSRVKILDTDITKVNLGLSNEEYINLGNCIDLVINAAANVRYYGNYNDFKKINVDVVSHLSEFCIKNDIQFVHVSTLGVSGNYLVNHTKNYNDFNENDFYIGQKYDENVYIQTKFEAEKIIYEKIESGLHASIIRVGNLTSRFSDGVFQTNFSENAFYNILLIILKYNLLPSTMMNEFLEFTPVDYCAKAIYNLITNFDINRYVFHVLNDNYISTSNLVQIFENLGFNISILSGHEFKNRLLALSNQHPDENILKGVVNDLDDTLGLSFKSTVNQQNYYTNSYLKETGFNWPKIEENYIKKIIIYLKNKKYI